MRFLLSGSTDIWAIWRSKSFLMGIHCAQPDDKFVDCKYNTVAFGRNPGPSFSNSPEVPYGVINKKKINSLS